MPIIKPDKKNAIVNLIYSFTSFDLAADSKNIGACPNALAILSKNDLLSNIYIGNETDITDFPLIILEPILLIILSNTDL